MSNTANVDNGDASFSSSDYELDSDASDTLDVTCSDHESDYVPSSTSEDREFVVSDTEDIPYFSDTSTDSSGDDRLTRGYMSGDNIEVSFSLYTLTE